MKKIICASSLCLLLAGCKAKERIVIEQRDSIRTEVVERVVYVPDTVSVEIEREVEKVVVRDTVSDLRNKYAHSRAQVLQDGYLLHTLESIPQTIVVERPAKVVYKDSIVYRDRLVNKEVIKEKRLSLLERIKMTLLPLLAGFLLGAGLVALKK